MGAIPLDTYFQDWLRVAIYLHLIKTKMEKQTAVKWFSDNVWKLKSKLENKEITLNKFCSLYFELYEQAKEMEKEQITEAYMSALPYGLEYSHYDKYANKYYNETYNKEI